MDNKHLTLEEIICLQWIGLTNVEILHTDPTLFKKLYNEQNERFEVLLDKARRILDRQHELGIQTISWQDKNYPTCLTDIGKDAPPLIHLLGNIDLLKEPNCIAIIGARAANEEGLEASYRLGRMYAERGEVIVSGLALGCDAAAHKGCLSVSGKTIAIVASGLDITHPREHTDLQKRILTSGGLLLSEQLVGVKANPKRLIARNRLQAALSQSVILVQCPEQSGSMITMDFARKYRKKCWAVFYSQSTKDNGGNHLLIEQGKAKPIIMQG